MGAETGQVAAAHLARLRWHELATASASASAAAAGYGHGAVDGDAHAHASEEGRNHHGADGSDSGADVVVASEAVLFDESAAEARRCEQRCGVQRATRGRVRAVRPLH